MTFDMAKMCLIYKMDGATCFTDDYALVVNHSIDSDVVHMNKNQQFRMAISIAAFGLGDDQMKWEIKLSYSLEIVFFVSNSNYRFSTIIWMFATNIITLCM